MEWRTTAGIGCAYIVCLTMCLNCPDHTETGQRCPRYRVATGRQKADLILPQYGRTMPKLQLVDAVEPAELHWRFY